MGGLGLDYAGVQVVAEPAGFGGPNAIILLVGQSNMVGYSSSTVSSSSSNYTSNFDTTIAYPSSVVSSSFGPFNVSQLSDSSNDNVFTQPKASVTSSTFTDYVIQAATPLDHWEGGGTTHGLGLAKSFVDEATKSPLSQYGFLKTNGQRKNITLIPTAWGGTGFKSYYTSGDHVGDERDTITWLAPNSFGYNDNYTDVSGITLSPRLAGKLYEHAVTAANSVLSLPELEGCNLVAILWHQGETDRINVQFARHFYYMIQKMRHDITGANQDTPFIMGEVAQTYPNWSRWLQAVHEHTPNVNYNTAFVRSNAAPDSNNQSLDTYDNTHFVATDVDILGKRYFTAFKEVKDGSNLYPALNRLTQHQVQTSTGVLGNVATDATHLLLGLGNQMLFNHNNTKQFELTDPPVYDGSNAKISGHQSVTYPENIDNFKPVSTSQLGRNNSAQQAADAQISTDHFAYAKIQGDNDNDQTGGIKLGVFEFGNKEKVQSANSLPQNRFIGLNTFSLNIVFRYDSSTPQNIDDVPGKGDGSILVGNLQAGNAISNAGGFAFYVVKHGSNAGKLHFNCGDFTVPYGNGEDSGRNYIPISPVLTHGRFYYASVDYTREGPVIYFAGDDGVLTSNTLLTQPSFPSYTAERVPSSREIIVGRGYDISDYYQGVSEVAYVGWSSGLVSSSTDRSYLKFQGSVLQSLSPAIVSNAYKDIYFGDKYVDHVVAMTDNKAHQSYIVDLMRSRGINNISYSDDEFQEPVEPDPILGCTDSSALNYNSSATQNDGSCEYDIYGCTDPNATNYNSNATQDNGTCTYPEPEDVLGCTDSEAQNYNPDATADDGSCTYPPPPAPDPPVVPSHGSVWLATDSEGAIENDGFVITKNPVGNGFEGFILLKTVAHSSIIGIELYGNIIGGSDDSDNDGDGTIDEDGELSHRGTWDEAIQWELDEIESGSKKRLPSLKESHELMDAFNGNQISSHDGSSYPWEYSGTIGGSWNFSSTPQLNALFGFVKSSYPYGGQIFWSGYEASESNGGSMYLNNTGTGSTAAPTSTADITNHGKTVYLHLRAIERYNTNTLDPNQDPTSGSSGSIRATTSSGSSSSVTPMGGY